MPARRDYEVLAGSDCPICGRARTLVAPDCAEGHGADCPDRVCVDCGSALFVDPVVTALSHRGVARIA